MGDEAAEVVGDEGVAFADADAGWLLADDPAADNGVVAVEVGEGGEFLVDIPFGAVFACRGLQDSVRADEFDIRAFAGENGLFYVVAEVAGFGVGRQEPGAAGIEFPEDRE